MSPSDLHIHVRTSTYPYIHALTKISLKKKKVPLPWACQVIAAVTVGRKCFLKATVTYAQSPGPSGKWACIHYSQGIKGNMTAATTTGERLISESPCQGPELTQA